MAALAVGIVVASASERRRLGASRACGPADEFNAAYLLIPAETSFWTEQAAADPRLVAIYSDRGATLYRLHAGNDAQPVP